MTTPSGVTSTVPGALTVLQGHFQAVAADNPDLDLAVYLGPPTGGRVANNFLGIGDPLGEGKMINDYAQGFQGVSQGPHVRRTEDYSIHCVGRAWSGSSDPIGRITDAFAIYNAVVTRLSNDIQGSGALTPSGRWGVGALQNTAAGPLGEPASGWGFVFEFDVDVDHAILTNF